MNRNEQQTDELIKLAHAQARYHQNMKTISKQISANIETIANMKEQFKHLQQTIIELEAKNKELMHDWNKMHDNALKAHTLLVDLSSVMMDYPTKKEKMEQEREYIATAYMAGMNREWIDLEPAMGRVLSNS